MTYCVVAIICYMFLGLAIANMYANSLIPVERKKMFYLLAGTIMFETLIDATSFSINGVIDVPIEVHKTLKILEHSITPIITMIIARIIIRDNYWHKLKKYFIILFFVNAVAQVTNFFVPVMYAFEDGIYHRTIWNNLYYVNLIVCACMVIYSSRYSYLQNDTSSNHILMVSIVFLAISVIIRSFVDNCNSDWLAMSFTFFIFLLYFKDEYARTDRMTTLLNRNAFDVKFSRIKYSTALVMIDMNNLKLINDTYLHEKGDKYYYLYKIYFSFADDINEFEEAFMNNIKFE